MTHPSEKAFAALREELVIGPDHHRFQLVSHQCDHFLGSLWLAEDISTAARTPVSLLLLRPELVRRPGFNDQLRKRITRLRPALQHPHIAACYGYFSWRGLEFLSYEALDGKTLSDLMRRKQASRLSASQKQGLLTQLAKALDHARQQSQLPHGTLAPDQIFLNSGAGVKLLGSGLRDLLDPLRDLLPLAAEYPRYQPPEGFHPQPLTPAADVYALAVLAWELHTGKQAFQADENEASRYQRELKAPSSLSKPQWSTLRTALNPDPEQRYSSCTALIRALYAPEPSPEPDEAPDLALDAEQTPASGVVNAETASAKTATAEPLTSEQPSDRTPRWRQLAARFSPNQALLRWLLGGALFGAGFVAGVWATLLLLQEQLDTVSGQALAQMKQNRELRSAFESLEQTNRQLEHRLEEAQRRAPSAPAIAEAERIESAKALREASQPVANLSLFQDELAGGGRGPQMAILPSGRFRMGDLHGQGDDNEYPVHEVVIAHGFALSRHEVTFAEYDRFAQATGRPLPADEGWGRGSRPVINVSWRDASAYTVWLREQTGQPYRLPTEAEWEYAARAGTESMYWWGDSPMDGYAVCDGCGSQWDGQQTAPVGSTRANPWGLFDLSGNVDEWVQDCYQPDYSQAPKDGSAEQASGCHQRVMRGGSWFDIPRLVRPASRYRHPEDSARNSWGFRVALDLPDSMQ
ncbi:SUMF1/EgtB/PvdO family nonheme iron enzyme [Marinobacterium weihaiense]|uniref:SUMF1/EgtB/PvdO family nonheme iron enzyme n=1 Tax=Marinobacterium weihaiense TaxID=2851016 RepID=A0ABS6M8Y3_9GAMM|nr:SUMF1/EgtB/PvdO family nonheme iron enzyme [Marinobacterium weihaiense]MBV0932738.1 SUMF1/EgtB/PvdO family nonheme iron enzyme [Marinobacterium weihaiense]